MDARNTNDNDQIRFTNNSPIFQISKTILDTLKGSFIDDQREEEKRTNDGSIYLDYPGNDIFFYYLLDYLNGKKINFDSFCYEEQLEILDIRILERRDRKMKKYEKQDEVSLIINGNKNDTIKDQYVMNGTIDIETEKIVYIDKELLEKEMIELFGDKRKEETKEAMIPLKF
ncbi:hypothetical protein WA158_004701 [Blastocystis sp. Blastoise]